MPSKSASKPRAPRKPSAGSSEIAALKARIAELEGNKPAISAAPGILENRTPNPIRILLMREVGFTMEGKKKIAEYGTTEVKFGPMPIPDPSNPTAPAQQIEGDTPYRQSVEAWVLDTPEIVGMCKAGTLQKLAA